MLMQKRDEEGFTLIEVMITIAIIAVGMLAMASMLIGDMQFNQSSESRIDGGGIAQSVMAGALIDAETAGYNGTASGSAIAYAHIPSGQATIAVLNPSTTPAGTATVAGTGSLITVTFSWNDHGTTRQVVLRSWAVTE